MSEDNAQMGRPTIYTDELVTDICKLLMQGNSLRKICESKDMPAMSTIMDWLADEKKDFSEQYAHARQIQAELMIDEILDIADDSQFDVEIDDNGNEVVNHERVQRSRLRVDARKWTIEKLAPKKYGKKVEAQHTSPDGSMTPVPLTADVAKEINKKLEDEY